GVTTTEGSSLPPGVPPKVTGAGRPSSTGVSVADVLRAAVRAGVRVVVGTARRLRGTGVRWGARHRGGRSGRRPGGREGRARRRYGRGYGRASGRTEDGRDDH